MAETAGERNLAPTPKRLREAARLGDVLRSRDLAVAAAMCGGASVLKLTGPALFVALARVMRLGLDWDRASLDDFTPARLLLTLGLLVLPPVLLLGASVVVMTLIAQLGITGPGRINLEGIAPRAGRLNPANGLARMFGMQGWIEVGKGLIKLALLGTVAAAWVRGRFAGLLALGKAGLAGQLAYGWATLTSLLFVLAGALLVIGLIDFPMQWRRRQQRLRMSLQEMKDEHREADGSPENKRKIRQRQRAMAMASVAVAMKRAQFVITNPTHFAVALAYDPDLAPAPVVLAKGRGEKALAIRELAADYALPCLEYPALARAVYYTTRESQMIREELYAAVASVLAFVFSLKRGERRPAPAIAVPVALRFDAEGRPDPDDAADTTR